MEQVAVKQEDVDIELIEDEGADAEMRGLLNSSTFAI